MARPGTELQWCWAGLATIGLLGLALSDARELGSSTERVVGFDAGTWIALAPFPIDDAGWSFEITPLAAWWGIGLGALVCALGWSAQRSSHALPFGVSGGLLWLTTLAVLFADNLLLAYALMTVQSALCGLRLACDAKPIDAGSGLRRWIVAALIGDAITLWGVLLAGLAWGTFEFAEFQSIEFVQAGWRERPAWCGLAGTCLFLGVLGRGALFPFLPALRVAATVNGPTSGLVFGVCWWPCLAWYLLRIQPILSCAPETVSLVQGLSLLAAVAAAFVATVQADSSRAVSLLATSQFGMMLAVLAVSQTQTPIWVSLVLGVVSLAAVVVSSGRTAARWAIGPAWWVLAGGIGTPIFWMSAHAGAEFLDQPVLASPVESTGEPEAPDDEDAARVQPLPATTWTAAWCLWLFFATFAGWRAWKSGTLVRDNATERNGERENGIAPSVPLSLAAVVTLLAAAGYAASLVLQEFQHEIPWPIGAATAASIAGWLTAAWVCRDPARIEVQFDRLGTWSSLALRELQLEEIADLLVHRPLGLLTQLICAVEDRLLPAIPKFAETGLIRRLVTAADELRSETAPFYAVALGATIGALLITWLTFTG